MYVKSLAIYPLKAGEAHAVQEAQVTPEGLAGDRRFVLVDARGTFASQRSLPGLARLHLSVGPSGLTLTWGEKALSVTQASGRLRSVKVWKDEVQAQDWGDEVHRFVSDLAGQDLWLCEALAEAPRHVARAYTGNAEVPYYFADGFPFLVIAEESLLLLNEKLERNGHAPVSMNRFRPNIVIAGWEAHAEDKIQRIRLGQSIELQLAKPCSRCLVTCVEQETGRVGKEPLQTLSSYRRVEGQGVLFGQNAYLLAGAGEILRVGDRVEVLGT